MTNRNMGLGPLGSTTTIFVRKFRWTLESQHLVEYFVNKASFNFTKKRIRMQCYEVIFGDVEDVQLQAWLESDLKDEVLTFTTYDGCGNALYQYQFHGLKVVSDTSSFDYSDSGISCRNVILSYAGRNRKFMANQKQEPERKPEVSPMYPDSDVEDVEVNFMNTKMWIPGKLRRSRCNK